jgi:hypothetical protein
MMPRHSGSTGTMFRQIHWVKNLAVKLVPITLAELIAFYAP